MGKLIRKIRGRVRIINYDIQVLLKRNKHINKDNQSVDVIIPAIEKNLKTLPVCIEGIRNCVAEKITNIYIIAPDVPSFHSLCKEKNVIFVDENSVLGYSAKDINLITTSGQNRSGWIFQQFLKLSGNIGTEENYFVCDADHILIQPHVFINQQHKYVFYQSSECHTPYYENIKKLIGLKNLSSLSYVDHKMIFNKKILERLKTEIEEKQQMRWDKAILASLDISTDSPFSEYELYGNYVADKCKVKLPWQNKNLANREIIAYNELKLKYADKYRTVTFPGYNEFK